MSLTFKTAIPAGIKSYQTFSTTPNEFVVFGVTKAGTYDLSFGNQQREALNYMTTSLAYLAAYTKEGKFIAVYQSANMRDFTIFKDKLVIIQDGNSFAYFADNKFTTKNIKYPYSVGRGGVVNVLEATDDVLILNFEYFAKPSQKDIQSAYDGLVRDYNAKNPKIKLGKLTAPRRPGYEQFYVNIMIDDKFDVVDFERYWYVPTNQYGFQQAMKELDNFDIKTVMVI